jgi:hypothetical protein
MQQAAVEAFHALRLRDYARIDLRVTENEEIFVIEVNPNCYLERESEFARAAAQGGFEYDALIARILELASGRYSRWDVAEKRKKPAIAGFFAFERGLAALLGTTTLLGTTALLGTTTLLGATLSTTALLCSHGNLSIMECSTLDRSPGGPARRRCGAEALRSPRHMPPRRHMKLGDSYVRQLVFPMLRRTDARHAHDSVICGE